MIMLKVFRRSSLVAVAIGISLLVGNVAPTHADDQVATCTLGVDCETGNFGLPLEVIAENPTPNVTAIQPDDNSLYDRRYRRVNGAVTVHDAPNGTPIETIDTGFNFVTLGAEQDGWSQIGANKWVPSSTLTNDVSLSRFAGVRLPETPLPYTVAWMLVHVYPSQYPGGSPTESNPLYYRYSVVYIYDTVIVDGWRWYQIGVDQWVKQTQVAKILPVERFDEIDTQRWFSVDLYEQVLIAYDGNQPTYATLVSSGMSEWLTNEGLFHVYVRYPRTVMTGAFNQPDFYFLQEVPWTMYFDNDIALHGAYWHDGFGFRRSHGCVNLSVTDAKLMYEWAAPEFDFSTPEDTGPAVYVYSSGDYR